MHPGPSSRAGLGGLPLLSHASFGSMRSKTVSRRGECFNIDFYLFRCARSSLWHARSSIFNASCKLSFVACGI